MSAGHGQTEVPMSLRAPDYHVLGLPYTQQARIIKNNTDPGFAHTLIRDLRLAHKSSTHEPNLAARRLLECKALMSEWVEASYRACYPTEGFNGVKAGASPLSDDKKTICCIDKNGTRMELRLDATDAY